MMTIGGAIGVWLSFGSSSDDSTVAGPGVILSYLFSAVIAVIVAYSVAEMAVVHPVAEALRRLRADLPQRFGRASPFKRNLGSSSRSSLSALRLRQSPSTLPCGFPLVLQWVWVVGVSVGLIVINAMQVGNFAEF